jgi:hypothetical protein
MKMGVKPIPQIPYVLNMPQHPEDKNSDGLQNVVFFKWICPM